MPALRIVMLISAAFFTLIPRPSAGAEPDACRDLAAAVRAASDVPETPLLLPSFPTAPAGPLHQAAFLYDNAVAVIALAGCGNKTDAERIGRALVYAQAHDRFWHDGRLRNAYRAGPLDTAPVKLAGWWDDKSQSWLEDRYQAGSDSGNLAWAMLALLTLDRIAPSEPAYRDAAIRLGAWLRQWRDDGSGGTDAANPGGFRGGAFGHEPEPQVVGWKSTEHNTDLAAAYQGLAEITGDASWRRDAMAARRFALAMWQPAESCFAAGTGEDGRSRNRFVALDAQIWPLLALPEVKQYQDSLLQDCLPRLRQDDGYAYSAALHGMWTEGMAQVALLVSCRGDPAAAHRLMAAIASLHAPTGGFYATDQDRLPTGFMLPTDPGQPRFYFHLPHLGATAWVALAQRGVNPFMRGRACTKAD
ncbi:MAG TPA: hypothetical protein VM639_22260 [Dongiaceae bacterium]|nr:hypothetical protein [Dongiaceae bacterium]